MGIVIDVAIFILTPPHSPTFVVIADTSAGAFIVTVTSLAGTILLRRDCGQRCCRSFLYSSAAIIPKGIFHRGLDTVVSVGCHDAIIIGRSGKNMDAPRLDTSCSSRCAGYDVPPVGRTNIMSSPVSTLLDQLTRYVSRKCCVHGPSVFIDIDDTAIGVNGVRIIVACSVASSWIKELCKVQTGVKICMRGWLPPFYDPSITVEQI